MLKREYARLSPAPKYRYVQLGTGIHSYWRTEEGLPMGTCPVIVKVWHDAIRKGFYEV